MVQGKTTKYRFQYQPLNGKLSGESFEQQTEDVINDLGQVVYEVKEQSTQAGELAQSAMDTARKAQETADRAESKADNAQQTADAALSAGNASGESAAAAMLAAKKAQSTADTAVGLANSAQSAADKNSEQITVVKHELQEAKNTADNAVVTANNALSQVQEVAQRFDDFDFEKINEAVDINGYFIKLKRYYIANAAANNLPVSSEGWLDIDICNDDEQVRQIYRLADGTVYTRAGVINAESTAATWGEWSKNATQSELDSVRSDVENNLTQNSTALENHKKDFNNPHKVTAAQLGLASAYVYKGSVENYENLPQENIGDGWVYNVQNKNDAHNIKAGDNVAWTGSAWDVLSGIFDTTQIDASITDLNNRYDTLKTTVADNGNKITALENKTANIVVENGKTIIDGVKIEGLINNGGNIQELTKKVNENISQIAELNSNKADKNDTYTKNKVDEKLLAKASLESPDFTGKPTAPTAEKETNDNQIATTAFVKSVLPASSEINYATQEEALAGTDNTKVMTPLRVKEAIDDKAKGYVPVTDVGNAANKIPRYNANGHLVLPNGAEFWIG